METILNSLIAEQSAVDNLLSGLSPEQWNNIGGEGYWQVTVKDILIHIAFFDYAAKMLSSGDASDMSELIEAVTMDEDFRIEQYRNCTPEEVFSWWRKNRTEMCACLYNKNPKDRVPWAAGLPMSARSIASARLMELWAHSTDICSALGIAPIVLSDSTIDSTLFLSWQARPNAYRINGLELPDTPIYLELVLPSGKIWSKGDPCADNYIKGSALEWALVSIRRVNWMDTNLDVHGDEARVYASIVQTYAGGADKAPKAKIIR